jgi:hypothetical protein
VRRCELPAALLVLVWAHASETSARHVLLYVILAGSAVARVVSGLLEQAARRGGRWLGVLQEVAADYGLGRMGVRRSPAFGPLGALLALAAQSKTPLG